MRNKVARELRKMAGLDLKAAPEYGRLKTSRAIVRTDESKMKYNAYKKSYYLTVRR